MTAYATLVQVKAALRITDSVDDTLIEMAREAASDLVDGYTGGIALTHIEVVPQPEPDGGGS